MGFPKREERKLTHCTNCETELEEGENFCPLCGQKNVDRKVPLWMFIGDFIRDELKIDNRLLRTFRRLIFNPGFLTNEFIIGKRKGYILPAQLFLLCGFICFFIISFQIDPEIKKIKAENFNVISLDGLGIDSTQHNVFLDYMREKTDEANQRPAEFIKNSLQKLPFVLLFILPIYTLFQHLIYLRHKMYFVEHFVFLLHVHAFLFLLFFAAALIMVLFGVPGLFAFIPFLQFIYLVFAFKRVYRQRWGRTLFIYLVFAFLFFI
ncbi:MAG: DUF3667 domain-containing protein [Bacteroidota bacterium]